jgi:hypothetical protein
VHEPVDRYYERSANLWRAGRGEDVAKGTGMRKEKKKPKQKKK